MEIPGVKVQAKHIPTQYLLELIKRLEDLPVLYTGIAYWDRPKGLRIHGVSSFHRNLAVLSDIEKLWSSIPPKVIRAKLRVLIKQGLIDGCLCGCQGDFCLTDKGSQELQGL